MAFRNPSYIFKSQHGIYYFQIRIPKFYSKKHNLDKSLIRKSLRTKNRKLAIYIASRLCLGFNQTIYLDETMTKKAKGLKQLEELFEGEVNILAEDFKNTQYISIAIRVTDRFSNFSEFNSYEREMFFESLEPYEMEALEYVAKNDIDLDLYRSKSNYNNEPKSSIENNNSATNLKKLEFEKLLSKYLDFCTQNKQVNQRTINLYKGQIKLFGELANISSSLDIDLNAVDLFVSKLPKVPKNRKKVKRYRNFSLAELLKMDIPKHDLLSDYSVLTYATNVKAFIDWAIKREYCSSSVSFALEGVFKKACSSSYQPFEDQDLKLLFMSPQYLNNTHTKASHYWVPLIALFTGARQNEICQLLISDIKQVHKNKNTIAYFDFNNEDNKTLKNHSSKRIVPIHPKLVEIGFLDFVKTREKSGNNRLFYELKEKNGKFNEDFSKWFTRYRDKCGVKNASSNKRKVFHSFRHTLATQLRNHPSSIPVENIKDVIGHTNKGTTLNVYAKNLSIENKYEIIKKIKFNLNFSEIRKWVRD